MKICSICKVEKPIEEFSPGNNKKKYAYCKPCASERIRLHRKFNPDMYRNYEYKKKYKITLDIFNKKLAEQNGVCAICRGVNKDRALAVDHDHNCCPGEVTCGNCLRALLCSSCNAGLGWFKHDIKIMESAILYMNQVKGSSWYN